MDPQLKKIIADGQKLAALAAPAFEAQQKLASTQKEAAELRGENERLRTVIETRGQTMKLAAEASADFFTSHGVLKVADRQEFVDAAVRSPEAVLKLAQDFADRCAGLQGQVGTGRSPLASLKTAGAGGDADGKRDAVDRFLHDG